MDLAGLAAVAQDFVRVGNQGIYRCPVHQEQCAGARETSGGLELWCDRGCTEDELSGLLGIRGSGAGPDDAAVVQGRENAAADPEPTAHARGGNAGSTPVGSYQPTEAGADEAALSPPSPANQPARAVPPPAVPPHITYQEMRIAEWQGALAETARALIKADPTTYRVRENLELALADAANHADSRTPTLHWPIAPQNDLEGALAAVALKVLGNGNGNAVTNGNGSENPLPTVLVRNTIEILDLAELRTRRRAHVDNWVVEGWLARGELSLWSGKVEHGKTTLMRELVMCTLRGEPFLGQPTIQGRVFYAMLDADGENLTYDEFEKVGLDDTDLPNIKFMFEPSIASMKNGPEQFFRALWDWRPALVVIDPFARLKEIGDFNDYNNTYLMAMLSQYCKAIDAHFALPGHIPRGRPAGAAAATAAFGSVAFGAGVNARFVVERKEGTEIFVLRSSKGKSAGFKAIEGEQVLLRDLFTNRISLSGGFSFKDQASAAREKVFQFLQIAAENEEFTPAAIARELGVTGVTPSVVRLAGNLLFEAQRIGRVGAGVKGNPYRFKKGVPAPEKEGENSTRNRAFQFDN